MVTWQVIWLAAALVGASIGFYTFRDRVGAITGFITGGLIMGMSGGMFFIGLMTSEVQLTAENIASGQCTPYETVGKIASIERNSESAGTFFLGTGSILSNMYYFAYVDTTNGWFLEKYLRNRTYIVEDESEPRVVTTNYKCFKPITSFLTDRKWYEYYYSRKHIIHVPPNTILREFNL